MCSLVVGMVSHVHTYICYIHIYTKAHQIVHIKYVQGEQLKVLTTSLWDLAMLLHIDSYSPKLMYDATLLEYITVYGSTSLY